MVLVDVSIAMVVVLKEITGTRAFVRDVMVQENAIIVEVLEIAPLVEDLEDGKKMTQSGLPLQARFPQSLSHHPLERHPPRRNR